MKSNELICYKYRGVLYQKTRPQKCLTNLVETRADRFDRDLDCQKLIYRGIPYSVSPKKITINRITSFRIQKYRGVNYLTCIGDLLTDFLFWRPPQKYRASQDLSE